MLFIWYVSLFSYFKKMPDESSKGIVIHSFGLTLQNILLRISEIGISDWLSLLSDSEWLKRELAQTWSAAFFWTGSSDCYIIMLKQFNFLFFFFHSPIVNSNIHGPNFYMNIWQLCFFCVCTFLGIFGFYRPFPNTFVLGICFNKRVAWRTVMVGI